jgi:hypothetical protein
MLRVHVTDRIDLVKPIEPNEGKQMATRTVKAAPVTEVVEEETEVSNSSESVLAFKSKKEKAPRVTLFSIDGEEFTVPAKPGANVTLRFLDELRRTGNEMFAALSLLETMLGKDKYQQFLDWEELEDEDLSAVLEQVVQLAMNRVEDVAGK